MWQQQDYSLVNEFQVGKGNIFRMNVINSYVWIACERALVVYHSQVRFRFLLGIFYLRASFAHSPCRTVLQ